MSESSWDKYRKKKPGDTIKHRDVYSDQQVDRSDIPEKQSPVSRIIFVTVVAIGAFCLAYLFISVGSYGKAVVSNMMSDAASNVSSGGSVESEIPDNIDTSGVIVTEDEVTAFARKQNYVEWPMTMPDGSTVEGWSMASDETFMTKEVMTEAYKRQVAWEQLQSESAGLDGSGSSSELSLIHFMGPNFLKLFWSAVTAMAVWGGLYQLMMKNLEAQNVLSDTASLNQYKNDQHIAFPEEVMEKFDWFPDVGAHCNVQVSSMISHVFLQNKGLKKVQVSQRASEDILDEDGDVEYLKGEILLDEDGNPIVKSEPLIDSKFGDALYIASGMPKDKTLRVYYDATAIKYNPGGEDRSKQGGAHATVAQMINADWVYPAYETQRPAGAYLVDTEPVNTIRFSKTACDVINA